MVNKWHCIEVLDMNRDIMRICYELSMRVFWRKNTMAKLPLIGGEAAIDEISSVCTSCIIISTSSLLKWLERVDLLHVAVASR